MKPIANWLFARLALAPKAPARRMPDLIIGDPAQPYLNRWWLLPRNPVLNVYLHQILRSDDDRALHDHPWWSLSLCLRGNMQEVTPRRQGQHSRWDYDRSQIDTLNITAGQWRLRSPSMRHRLALTSQGECWTLFVTGPVWRVWGFWCRHGFVPHHQFTKPGASGQVGAGCAGGASEQVAGLDAIWRAVKDRRGA